MITECVSQEIGQQNRSKYQNRQAKRQHQYPDDYYKEITSNQRSVRFRTSEPVDKRNTDVLVGFRNVGPLPEPYDHRYRANYYQLPPTAMSPRGPFNAY